jgi:hypothetical protein
MDIYERDRLEREGVKRLFFVKALPKKNVSSQCPSRGILWRIFSKTGILVGFSLYIINLAIGISEAAMRGEHYIFYSAP